jgi:hypothetical protein
MSVDNLLGGGGSSSKKANIEPAPTRDSAADTAEQERIRRAAQAGRSSTMLTGPYGVASDSAGSRQLSSG